MNKNIIVNYFNSIQFKDIFNFIDDKTNFIIYNKSGNSLERLPSNCTEILTENIGREGHTYLKYIIDYYDNLSEINIFIQDDFRNHLINKNHFTSCLNENLEKDFYMFPCSWREDDNIIYRQVNNGFLDLHFLPRDNNYIKEFSEKFEIFLPNSYNTETCAHFLLSKEKILKYPKEKYEQILDWLLIHENNGFVLEHCWKILFA
jgi:hypothetical protein